MRLKTKILKFIYITLDYRIGYFVATYLRLWKVRFIPNLVHVPDGEGSWMFKSLIFGKCTAVMFGKEMSYIQAKDAYIDELYRRRYAVGKEFRKELHNKISNMADIYNPSNKDITQVEIDNVYRNIQTKYEEFCKNIML